MSRLLKTLLILMVFLFSCVATEKKKDATKFQEQEAEPANNTSPIISGTPAGNGRESFFYSFQPTVLIANAKYSLLNGPSWLSINSDTGYIYGYPSVPGAYNNITIRAILGNKKTDIGPFTIYVFGDPLSTHQWHLSNSGQEAFAQNGGTSGYDINVTSVINQGYTGNGVRVAISDTGLELTHADLSNNIYTNFSKNYTLAAPYYGNPAPTGMDGDHGTSVAGIIGSVGWNEVGGRGIAPNVLMAGYNYLDSTQTSAIKLDQAQGNVEVFNYSYGASFFPGNSTHDFVYDAQLKNGFINERSGKGQMYIKSAGNSFLECDIQYGNTYLIDQGTDGYFCYSHNANVGTGNNNPYSVVVGALNAKGEKASYSSAGSSLWVSAPGGEFGSFNPAIVTTDQSGCTLGYSRSLASGTNFTKGLEESNEDCDYTHTFNGTSSAAPMVSGVVALIMEANPNLTARNIKHILAKTASKVNYSTSNISHPSLNSLGLDMNLSGHVYEQGYVTNAAGNSFHNYYGFGAVDATAAVNMAKTYSNSWGAQQHLNEAFGNASYDTTVSQAIPDASSTGVTSAKYIASNLTIEAVQIKINITHPRPGDLGIELTSPSGTKSILKNINDSFQVPIDVSDSPVWVADITDFVILSNAFYEESSQGTWTIKVVDALGSGLGNDFDLAATQTGTFDDWSINIIGH
ncbi:MAG: S8 family serine peptidase [Oligoflexia bacterium]|nr:S8 family serine peptidase [Oligoflexia bacterium]